MNQPAVTHLRAELVKPSAFMAQLNVQLQSVPHAISATHSRRQAIVPDLLSEHSDKSVVSPAGQQFTPRHPSPFAFGRIACTASTYPHDLLPVQSVLRRTTHKNAILFCCISYPARKMLACKCPHYLRMLARKTGW